VFERWLAGEADVARIRYRCSGVHVGPRSVSGRLSGTTFGFYRHVPI
jgi:hypothetical protein